MIILIINESYNITLISSCKLSIYITIIGRSEENTIYFKNENCSEKTTTHLKGYKTIDTNSYISRNFITTMEVIVYEFNYFIRSYIHTLELSYFNKLMGERITLRHKLASDPEL